MGLVLARRTKTQPPFSSCEQGLYNRQLKIDVFDCHNLPSGMARYGIPVKDQNVLFRRDIIGTEPYDLHYRYHADYDLIGRLLKVYGSAPRTGLPVSIIQRGGVSSKNFDQTMLEEEGLRQRHFGINRTVSKAITALKKLNRKLGSVPALRRLMRRWV